MLMKKKVSEKEMMQSTARTLAVRSLTRGPPRGSLISYFFSLICFDLRYRTDFAEKEGPLVVYIVQSLISIFTFPLGPSLSVALTLSHTLGEKERST